MYIDTLPTPLSEEYQIDTPLVLWLSQDCIYGLLLYFINLIFNCISYLFIYLYYQLIFWLLPTLSELGPLLVWMSESGEGIWSHVCACGVYVLLDWKFENKYIF